jgi:hypothetical protein
VGGDGGADGSDVGEEVVLALWHDVIHHRQLAGWRALTYYSDQYLTNGGPRYRERHGGGYWLADALGDRPWVPDGVRPSDGWQAHHIVQRTTSRTQLARAMMFCDCVHPNSKHNGVYPRWIELGRTLNGRKNPNYTKLDEYDGDHDRALAPRTYHGDTFRWSYSDELNTAFQNFIEHEDPEPCGAEDLPVHDQVVSELSTFRNRLLDGMYLSPGRKN